MAFVGVFALIGLDWTLLTSEYRLGIGFGILTALCYTGFILSMRNTQTSVTTLNPAANLALVSMLCSILLAILVFVEGNSFVIPDLKSAFSLLALGTLCQVLGWLLITSALAKLRASIVGVILLLQPALSMLWDTLFFNRLTGPLDILGSILVLTGIYLATALHSNKLQ